MKTIIRKFGISAPEEFSSIFFFFLFFPPENNKKNYCRSIRFRMLNNNKSRLRWPHQHTHKCIYDLDKKYRRVDDITVCVCVCTRYKINIIRILQMFV